MSEPSDSSKPAPMLETPLSREELLRFSTGGMRELGTQALATAIAGVVEKVLPLVSRPPGAIGEMDFIMACTRCGACSDACPPHAIKVLDESAGLAAGTPFLDVNTKPCVVCLDPRCMTACPTGALQVIPMRETSMGLATLEKDTCIAWLGGNCARCFNACPLRDDAIVRDDASRPFIDPRACIGCGLCVTVCPTSPKSIRVELERKW